MHRTIPTFLAVLFLTACTGGNIPLAVTTPIVSPSHLPAILSPTPPFIQSTTPILTASLTPALSGTVTPPASSLTGTTTATSTPAVSPTRTSDLSLELLGCDTSLDITHGMGEVTNAYPILRNATGSDLTKVCATLSASDEGRPHPDKTGCVPFLPNGYQVTLKLTVDTTFKEATTIQINVVTAEGKTVSLTEQSCRDLSFPGSKPDDFGVVKPIH